MTVNPEPVSGHVGPLGFHVRAAEFLEVANLARARNTRFSPVAAFLYYRAIELTLKAYLLARGDGLEHLAALRHDLIALLTEAHARGIDAVLVLSSDELQLLRDGTPDYRDHTLAYPELMTMLMGFTGQPDLDALAALARRIHNAVEQGCLDAVQGPWRPW